VGDLISIKRKKKEQISKEWFEIAAEKNLENDERIQSERSQRNKEILKDKTKRR